VKNFFNFPFGFSFALCGFQRQLVGVSSALAMLSLLAGSVPFASSLSANISCFDF
jgi:hypothetical protein